MGISRLTGTIARSTTGRSEALAHDAPRPSTERNLGLGLRIGEHDSEINLLSAYAFEE